MWQRSAIQNVLHVLPYPRDDSPVLYIFCKCCFKHSVRFRDEFEQNTSLPCLRCWRPGGALAVVEDPSVLLDLLIGAETEFLPYLTLLLRHAIDTWPVKNAHWPARTPRTRF